MFCKKSVAFILTVVFGGCLMYIAFYLKSNPTLPNDMEGLQRSLTIRRPTAGVGASWKGQAAVTVIPGRGNVTSAAGIPGRDNVGPAVGKQGQVNSGSAAVIPSKANLGSAVGKQGQVNSGSAVVIPGKANLGSAAGIPGKTNLGSAAVISGRDNSGSPNTDLSAPGAQSTTSLLCTQADIERRSATVVLTTTNTGFLDITENMLESIKRTRACPNITVIAEDEPSYQRLTQRMKIQPGLHVMRSPLGPTDSQSMMVNAPDYQRFVNRRPRYVLQFLKRGYDVLFVDSDTFWLKDPFKDFQGSFDVAMLNEFEKPQYVFCDGFAYYRRTENTLRLVEKWAHLCETARIEDQLILNNLISTKTIPSLSVKSLTPSNYPDGKRYFLTPGWREINSDTIVTHLTYILGHDAKVQTFKEFGWWLV